MPQRDPHDVLGVDRDASQATVKAAWRRLAREHHPDLASDSGARRDATRRMAEINAAYQALRSGAGGRAGKPGHPGEAAGSRGPGVPEAPRPSGPPPPPPTRPVTARLDTTDLFRPRNATTTPAGGGYRHRPRAPIEMRRATWGEAEEPRASDPTGPLQRVRARRATRRPLPDLDTARAMPIVFGKFHGRTLGEIEALEPTYLAWLERTITRDPDLVAAARVVLDRHAGLPGTGRDTVAGDPLGDRGAGEDLDRDRDPAHHPDVAGSVPADEGAPGGVTGDRSGHGSGDADRRPREAARGGSAG